MDRDLLDIAPSNLGASPREPGSDPFGQPNPFEADLSQVHERSRHATPTLPGFQGAKESPPERPASAFRQLAAMGLWVVGFALLGFAGGVGAAILLILGYLDMSRDMISDVAASLTSLF